MSENIQPVGTPAPLTFDPGQYLIGQSTVVPFPGYGNVVLTITRIGAIAPGPAGQELLVSVYAKPSAWPSVEVSGLIHVVPPVNLSVQKPVYSLFGSVFTGAGNTVGGSIQGTLSWDPSAEQVARGDASFLTSDQANAALASTQQTVAQLATVATLDQSAVGGPATVRPPVAIFSEVGSSGGLPDAGIIKTQAPPSSGSVGSVPVGAITSAVQSAAIANANAANNAGTLSGDRTKKWLVLAGLAALAYYAMREG